MLPTADLSTSVLFIDSNSMDRIHFAEVLQRCSPDYRILEAADGESGMGIYWSQRVDCVVLELDLEEQSGFQVLVSLVPLARRPTAAVIVLTRLRTRGLWELARSHGAYACFYKPYTSGEDLDLAIQRAIAQVGLLPKEDRHRLS
jgi:DNA-binding NarL/FixJ family response regulator